jgi:hypothetical protein
MFIHQNLYDDTLLFRLFLVSIFDTYKLFVVEVDPELAEEDEVRPDSSCWWRPIDLFWRYRRTIRTSATSVNAMIAMVSVPIRTMIELVLIWLVDEVNSDCIKSSNAELWPPRSDDMVDEMAGVELVCTI